MLTNIQVQAAKPKDKAYKLTDEKGMYLLVAKNGSRYWRMNYRFAGKRKTLALGVFPDVSLKDAREELTEARRSLAKGIDPCLLKHQKKLGLITTNADTFESVARDWELRHLEVAYSCEREHLMAAIVNT